MFAYTCPGCGVTAYSSANAATVRPCSRCGSRLELKADESRPTPAQAAKAAPAS
jgi:DNA-directed RNA polymerase subunit RPC12/RpoP